MPYHPNIPLSTDDPTASQQDLLENFGKVNTDFSVNHVPFTDGARNGQHTKVFFSQSLPFNGDPDLTPNQTSVYTKMAQSAPLGVFTTTNELCFQNSATPGIYDQLTNLPIFNGSITLTSSALGITTVTTSTPHGMTLASNPTLTIFGVYGAVELNGYSAPVTITSPTQFTIPISSSAYVAGGHYITNQAPANARYGMYTPWGITLNFGMVTSAAPIVNFAAPYIFPPYTALATSISNGAIAAAAIPTTSSATFSFLGATTGYYLVLGQ